MRPAAPARGALFHLRVVPVSQTPIIRSAVESDAPTLLDIYRPYVLHTTISFELTPPTIEEFAARMRKAVAGWAWLVAESEGRCVGYAYASLHRERPAYRWSVETSAYVHPDFQRRGIARTLYGSLFDALVARGYCNALAGVALPNAASIALHESVGFRPVGVFSKVGHKFGAWHDVAWLQRPLGAAPPDDRA